MLQHYSQRYALTLAILDHDRRGLEGTFDGLFHQNRLAGFHKSVDRIDPGVGRRRQDRKIDIYEEFWPAMTLISSPNRSHSLVDWNRPGAITGLPK